MRDELERATGVDGHHAVLAAVLRQDQLVRAESLLLLAAERPDDGIAYHLPLSRLLEAVRRAVLQHQLLACQLIRLALSVHHLVDGPADIEVLAYSY